MARQNYQRLSPADIDEIWSRMRCWACGQADGAGARASRPARCGPTCSAAAGSDLTRDTGQLAG